MMSEESGEIHDDIDAELGIDHQALASHLQATGHVYIEPKLTDDDSSSGGDDAGDDDNDGANTANARQTRRDAPQVAATNDDVAVVNNAAPAASMDPLGERSVVPRHGKACMLPQEGWEYDAPQVQCEYTDAPYIQLMSDFALASHSALRNAFPDRTILFTMCGFHAWGKWSKSNRKLFRDYKAHAPLMNIDFKNFRYSPSVSLLPFLLARMIEKWFNKYREKEVAKKWDSSWARTVLGAAKVNECGVFKGGLPTTNNILEGRNSADKYYLDHRVKLTADLIDEMCLFLSDRSKQDFWFCEKLNQKVHNQEFYKKIYRAFWKAEKGEATFINVAFSFSSTRMKCPTGSLLVATREFISGDLKKRMDREWRSVGKIPRQHYSADECKRFIARHEIHLAYKNLMNFPDRETHGKSFDSILSVTKQFHIVRPLCFTCDRDKQAVGHFIDVLERSGLKTIPIEDIEALGNKGLVSCLCQVYLHRAWCEHSFSFALQRGIILDYPLTLHPKPTIPTVPGRPRDAQPGDTHNRHNA